MKQHKTISYEIGEDVGFKAAQTGVEPRFFYQGDVVMERSDVFGTANPARDDEIDFARGYVEGFMRAKSR